MLQAAKYFSTIPTGHPKPHLRNGRFINPVPNSISYHKHLNDPDQVSLLQRMYRPFGIVYGLRCDINNMIYVGSSHVPGLRFSKHLVTHSRSNASLQAAIAKYGLESFTALVYEKHK